MGFNFDITAAQNIIKVRYTDKKVETLAYKDPLVGMMPKDEDQGGLNYTGAIRSAIASSISPSDTTAFTTGSASVYNQWICQWKTLFGSANITGAAIDRAKGDANTLIDGMTGEFDGLFIGLGMVLGTWAYGNGGGSIGQISAGSNVGTATITLANPSQAVNFWQGQILQTSVDDGTGGAGVDTGGNGYVTVAKVDPVLGTITATGNWNAGITGTAASHYIFLNGGYNGAFPGLAGWLPDVNHRPGGADSFNGVNRSVDGRLAGAYYQGNGNPFSESLIQLAIYIGRYSGAPDVGFVNWLDFASILKEQQGHVVIATESAFKSPQIGFKGVTLMAPTGEIKIFPSTFCPQGTGYLLTKDTWLMPSAGKVPRVFSDDGNTWLRASGSDAFQLRGGTRAVTTYCSDPAKNGVVTF